MKNNEVCGMGRARRLTRLLRSLDPQLYCAESGEGKLCVYRNSKRFEDYWIDSSLLGDSTERNHSVLLKVSRPAPHYIFALTDSWLPSGNPVEWSWDKIKFQLQKHDSHNQDVVARLEMQDEIARASSERTNRNNAEAFASEFRPMFKKAFSDVNTSSMSKVERKQKDDKNFKAKY